jgi:hypothetical protein
MSVTTSKGKPVIEKSACAYVDHVACGSLCAKNCGASHGSPKTDVSAQEVVGCIALLLRSAGGYFCPPDLTPWTTAKRIEQKWNRASTTEKNKVLRVLVEKVIVHPPTGKWTGRGLDPDRVEIIWRNQVSETPSTVSKSTVRTKKKKGS